MICKAVQYIRSVRIQLWIVIPFCVLAAGPAIGGDFLMRPKLTIGGGYNDNITFERTETVEDYYASARPVLLINFNDELFRLNVESSVELYRYAYEKDLDNEIYDLNLDSKYKPGERVAISSAVSYLRDTTIDSELEETGRVVAREKRERIDGSATLIYQINELSEFNLGYQYEQTEYETNSRVGRRTHTLQIPYSRYFNNRIDKITINPLYSQTNTDNDRTINYFGLSLGWNHDISKTLTARYFVGYGYSILTGSNDSNIGKGNADISLTRTGEIFSLTTGLRSKARINADGEQIEVDRLYIRLKKMLSERFKFLFSGRVIGSRPLDTYQRFDTVYWDVRPQLTYSLTENFSLSFFYRYSSDHDSTITGDQDRDRHITEFRIDYQFPN